MSRAYAPPCQTHKGARAFKAKECQGWEPLSGVCLSVSGIMGTQRPDCVSCMYTGLWGCFRDLLVGEPARCQQAANWAGRWWN